MKRFFIIFLSLYILPAQATDYTDLAAYEIEVIIFEQKNGQAADSEIWPDLVTTAATDNSIELHYNSSLTLVPGPDEKAFYYSYLRQDKLRLQDEAEKLKNSGKYEILYHQGWIQPGLNESQAEAIHVQTEHNSNVPAIVTPINTQNDLTSAPGTLPLIYNPAPAETKPEPKLDGTVKVVLGRYLHINFDLKYKRSLTPVKGVIDTADGKQYEDIRYYPVQTHRRMRSKEVHYIDHPLIGILVLATPFELPTQPAEETSNELIKLNSIPVQ